MLLRTIEQAAEYLVCSDDQVRVLIRNLELPYVNIGAGKQRRCIRITQGQHKNWFNFKRNWSSLYG